MRAEDESTIPHEEEKREERIGKRGRFFTNITTNVATFVFNTFINIWFIPYLINNLGVAAYGLVPLTTTVTSYMRLLTLVLNAAVGRYITIALEKKDYKRANSYFNTSFLSSIIFAVLFLPLGFWLAMNATAFFIVPEGFEHQARLLFGCAIGMFILSEIAAHFHVASFCLNRFDVRNIVNVSATIARIGLVVLFFTFVTPKLWYVGLGILAAGAVQLGGAIMVWRMLTPFLVIRPSLFDKGAFKDLVSFGGWTVINQLGSILFLGIDLIILNRVLGAEASGRYAAILMWSILLRSFAGIISGVFTPTAISLYARNDIKGLVRYIRLAVKFTGLVIALPVALVCGFSRQLLDVWLGQDFAELAPLLVLLTAHLCINLCVLPIFGLQAAMKKIRLPAAVTCAAGAVNLWLAIVLTGPMGWGMYGVATAGAIMLTLKNGIFTPMYAAKILGKGYSTFYPGMLIVIAAAGGATLLCLMISSMIDVTSWSRLVPAGLAVSLIYALSVYWVFLTKEERLLIKRILLSEKKESSLR